MVVAGVALDLGPVVDNEFPVYPHAVGIRVEAVHASFRNAEPALRFCGIELQRVGHVFVQRFEGAEITYAACGDSLPRRIGGNG